MKISTQQCKSCGEFFPINVKKCPKCGGDGTIGKKIQVGFGSTDIPDLSEIKKVISNIQVPFLDKNKRR